MTKYDIPSLISFVDLAKDISMMKLNPPSAERDIILTTMERFAPALLSMETAEQEAVTRGVLVLPVAQRWQ